MDLEKSLEKIKNQLIEKFDCEIIVLFGSFARNTQNKNSDIDIAFKSKRKISKKEVFDMKLELEDIVETDVDLVNLDEANDDFKYEILISGKGIYYQDELKYELYKLDMYREYIDLNESRLPIIEHIRSGGSIYEK